MATTTEYVAVGHELDDERETLNARDAARRELRQAQEVWNGVSEKERRILRPQSGDAKLDGPEREVALAEVAREREEAARRLLEARQAAHEAAVADANCRLPALVETYEAAAAELAASREAVERAWTTLVDWTWRLGDAVVAEKQAQLAVVRAALAAARTDEDRQQLKFEAEERVPTEVDEDGPTAWMDRPHVSLFDGGEAMDPRRRAFWHDTGELALRGRKRGREDVGKFVRAALDAAAERR